MMAVWYRMSLPLGLALAGAALAWASPSTAARQDLQLSVPGLAAERSSAAMPGILLHRPPWLAIEDQRAGILVTLGDKWDEHPYSPEHEQNVLATPGWHFSRIYSCHPNLCGGFARTILSGGMLPSGIDIKARGDLERQMPRSEVRRVSALIAGLPAIDDHKLEPILRGAAFGYRARVSRLEPDGSMIALVIDCLYEGNRFLVLTAVTDAGRHQAGATLLDEIETGIEFKRASIQPR